MKGIFAVNIASRYASYCGDQAEMNHPQNIPAWQMWKDHAAGARVVARLIARDMSIRAWFGTRYSSVEAH